VKNIKVTRYSNPKAHGWAGYIEPEDASWIAFIGLDGAPRFFLHRHQDTGAILPDDPAEREEQIARLAREGDLRIGMAEDGTGWDGDSPLAVGERVFPLGEDGRSKGARPRRALVTNLECRSEEWWDAAAERAEEFPEQTRLFVAGVRPERAEVDAEQADGFMTLARTLPGWAPPYPVTAVDV
jgi:hypothetical protein